jgi:O-antigen/teichoic acid export membrane protein
MLNSLAVEKNIPSITVKNLFYNTMSFCVEKLGSFILTIILARMLLPEWFGMYTLLFSITLIFYVLIDLGIEETAVRYISRALGLGKTDQAFSYFLYLIKLKFTLLIMGVGLIFFFSEKIVPGIFDQSSMMGPVIFATVYLFINSLRNFILCLFLAFKDLSDFPFLNFILHSTKIIFSLLAVLFFSEATAISAVFIAFSLAALIALISTMVLFKRKNSYFFSAKKVFINKHHTNKYCIFIGIANFSFIAFGPINTVMMGIYIEPSFLAYYQSAFSMAIALTTLFSISGVIIPVYTQLQGEHLQQVIIKSLHYAFKISLPVGIGLLFIAKYAIQLFFGQLYLPAATPLYILTGLLMVAPFIEIYLSLFKAKKKVKDLAFMVLMSLMLNIVLNYLSIITLMKYGQEMVVVGVALATMVSRVFYLLCLIKRAKIFLNVLIPKSIMIKTIIGCGVMSIVLSIYNLYVEINIITVMLEILLGALVYITVMFLINGLGKDDIVLLKSVVPRLSGSWVKEG